MLWLSAQLSYVSRLQFVIYNLTWAGCCTSCAVRVKSGELRQPQALGISAELKSQVISLFLRLARDTSRLELRRQFVIVRVCVCEKLGPTLIESTKTMQGFKQLLNCKFAAP